MTSTLADAVTELATSFSGQLLQPSDAGYDDARKIHNGLIDKRPALIARCRGVADVVDAVKLARRMNLEVAVRGGGHNVAGRATIDAGLMIDLMPMKGVLVDSRNRTVRAQGGVTWAELNRETQLLWPRGHGRRGLHYRHRGSYPRRRAGLADGQIWVGAGQPTLGRTRHRRWQGAAGEQGRRARFVLGLARWRRQFRRCNVIRVPASPGGSDDHRRTRRTSF